MRRFRRLIYRGIDTPINPVGMFITGVYMVIWGLFIFSPTWDAFGANVSLIPEIIIGAVSTILGTIVCMGAFVKMERTLPVACFVSLLTWLATAVVLILSNWQNPEWIGSLFAASLCAYFYLNLTVPKSKI